MLSNILSHIIIFVLVAIFGSIQCSVQAKITIYDKDWDPIVVSSTYDRFHVRTEYYDKKGFLLNIGFNSTLSSCTFNRLRSHMKIASTVVASAPTYSSFAYLVNWAEAVARRCGTVENVMQLALEESAYQQTIGFPPIDLIVFYTAKQNGTAELWGPTFDSWGTDDELNKVKRLTPTFISREGAMDMLQADKRFATFHLWFHATEEPGPWNEYFFNTGFQAKTWILFGLAILCLFYAVIRFGWLIYLGGVRRDLRLTIMILAIISTSLFCYRVPSYGIASVAIDQTSQLLAIIAFELLLWHWSVRGKTIFPRKSVIVFRIFIVIHLLLELVMYIFYILRKVVGIDGVLSSKRLVFTGIVAPIAAFSAVIVFGGFGIWFFICTYRVRRHSQARWRFVQLSIFSLVASLTFILESTTLLVGGYGTVGSNNATSSEINYIDIVTLILVFIRSTICLGVWGVGWPRRGDNFDTPTSMNQQSNKGKDMKENSNSNNNNNNTNNNTTQDSKSERRWSTFGWIRLASALGHGRDSNHGSVSNNSSKLKVDPRRWNLLGENSICEEESMQVEAMGETIDIKTVVVTERYDVEQ